MVPERRRRLPWGQSPTLNERSFPRLPVHDRVPAETKRDRTAELPRISLERKVRKPFARAPQSSSTPIVVNSPIKRLTGNRLPAGISRRLPAGLREYTRPDRRRFAGLRSFFDYRTEGSFSAAKTTGMSSSKPSRRTLISTRSPGFRDSTAERKSSAV